MSTKERIRTLTVAIGELRKSINESDRQLRQRITTLECPGHRWRYTNEVRWSGYLGTGPRFEFECLTCETTKLFLAGSLSDNQRQQLELLGILTPPKKKGGK